MKALLLSAIVFFSLKAMATEVGEDQKTPCPFANQSSSREAKVVDDSSSEKQVEVKTVVGK